VINRTAFCISLMLASSAAATELENTDFATDLTGWEIITSENVSWSPDDVGGSNSSGSVEMINPNPGGGGTSADLAQCIVIENASFPFLLRAAAKVFEEGEPGVSAAIVVFEYRDTGCTQYVGFLQSLFVNFGVEEWEYASRQFSPNDDLTRSVAIRPGIFKEQGTGSGGRVRYDDLFFGNQDNLLRDRFEDL